MPASKEHWVGTVQQPEGRPQNVELFIQKRADFTCEESAAGIIWVDSRYPPGDVRRYGSDGVDDTTAIQASFDQAAQGGANPNLAGLSLVITSNVTASYGIDIISNGATIDGSSITAVASLDADGALVRLGTSSLSAVGVTDAAASAGDYQLDISGAVSGLVADDVFVIFDVTDGSFNGARAAYRKGEFCRVESVASDKINLYAPLWDNYDSGDTVKKLNGGSINIVGRLKIIGPIVSDSTVTYACIADGCVDSNLFGLNVFEAEYAAMAMYHCLDCVPPQTAGQTTDTGGATKYGLAIGYSSGCRAKGVHYFSRRHAVTTDTPANWQSLVCRDIDIEGTFESLGAAADDTTAVDVHGNCEFWRFGGTARGGVSVSGDHGVWDGDIYAIDAGNGALNHVAVYGSELLGWDFKIRGRVFASGDPVVGGSRGVVDIGGNVAAADSNTTRGGVFDISGLIIDAENATELVRIRNRGSSPTTHGPIVIRASNVESPRNSVAVDNKWFRYETISGDDAALVDVRASRIQGHPYNRRGTDLQADADLVLGAQVEWSATLTGLAADDTETAYYSTDKTTVTLTFETNLTGTSDDTAATITGLPTTLAPRAAKRFTVSIEDNGVNQLGIAEVGTDGVITLFSDLSGAAFTASGTKSVLEQSVTYSLS